MPSLALGIMKGIEIIERDKWRRKKLWENTRYLKNNLDQRGFNTLGSQTPIVPVLIGDEKTAIDISRELLQRGIFAPPIRWPAVPHGEARMRFTLTSEYSKKQLDTLLDNLTDLGEKYKLIQ